MTILSDENGLLEVACVKCKQWIGYADPTALNLPITGSMISRRPGTEHLQMPSPDATGMDLFCPFSITGDVADLHLFVPHIPGSEIEANTLELYRKVAQFKIKPKEQLEPEPEGEDGACPCGCGQEVKEGNKYATSGCVTRHRLRRE
jgi:hypothetical protein